MPAEPSEWDLPRLRASFIFQVGVAGTPSSPNPFVLVLIIFSRTTTNISALKTNKPKVGRRRCVFFAASIV